MKSYGNPKLVLALSTLIGMFLMQESVFAVDLGSKACKMWDVLEWQIANSSYPASNP